MEAFLMYSIKTLFVRLLFLLLYESLLKKEPYFRANRFFLLSGIVFSLVLPLFPIPVMADRFISTIRLEELIVHASNSPKMATNASEKTSIHWYEIIYSIGALCFGLLFILKMIRLNRLLCRSQREVLNGTRIFLLEDLTQAFTFMNKIYVGVHQATGALCYRTRKSASKAMALAGFAIFGTDENCLLV